MAATSSAALFSLALPPTSSRVSANRDCQHGPSTSSSSPFRASHIRCSNTSSSSAPTAEAPPKPKINLEFVGPKADADGSYPVDRVAVDSGEKLLRDVMLENKIELYAPYGKVMNCGGGGSCGTCIIEIIDGKELLNERTNTEGRYLKKKPEPWRLACQTIVGNKENSGEACLTDLLLYFPNAKSSFLKCRIVDMSYVSIIFVSVASSLVVAICFLEL
ncbi:hypothetical protein GUJ93_ZPchr0005g15530 [Zizania palustris]|uniref:2Fe-2S ferredoxin-type domain-containing protein n=1 Tax=Zizania palustris TaxID=103762 RepID=A0A8J5SN24_ZIZPA|nr:hypothetical protein GUJ93_ZPchr0005g15530 [Zizania palustris]